MDRPIAHEQNEHGGSFHMEEEGNRIAELTYTRPNASLIVVDYVRVDSAIEGQGVGRSLINAAVRWARESQTRIHPVCPFAVAIFRRDPSIRDVLDKPVGSRPVSH